MFNNPNHIHTLELRWKAQKREETKIIYERTREANEDLKSFIVREKLKETKISFDYIIDGVDFGLWLNLNYFTRRVIGVNYKNSLSNGFNFGTFEEINFYDLKILQKRILGQKITIEDSKNFCRLMYSKKSEEEILIEAESYKKDENKDTMLYYSACCYDRLCGYFGIKVLHTNNTILWFCRMTDNNFLRINFDKSQYFEAFQELVELINNELEKLGTSKINFEDEGERRKDITTKLNEFIQTNQIDANTFNKENLQVIFEKGDIEEIDTALYFANKMGIDLNSIKKEIEQKLDSLPKAEQNSLAWKILDNSTEIGTMELTNRALAKRVFLLYG